MGVYVDALKFAGGSFSLMPREVVKELIDLCHEHDVLVSTGGLHRVRADPGPRGRRPLHRRSARSWASTSIEISTGFITHSHRRLAAPGRAGPEGRAQGQAGGGDPVRRGRRHAGRGAGGRGDPRPGWAIDQAQRFLDAGAYMIMIESEGITENVRTWRTDVAARIVDAAGAGEGDVRGRRPRGLRLVHQELRPRGEPLRRSQPDRPARMPALGHLGNEEPLGAGADL